ncbi:MAG: MBL fold metallo-hydrolase [Lachnospiraceae bacterium]|nr:MBL fold metallo-hydrolase [Lachnospiraceae bacterium]
MNKSSHDFIFSNKKISDHFYIVTEHCFRHKVSCIYVLVGAKKILVVDTGLGLGRSLYQYVKELLDTQLPLICICTHGHPDCIGGIGQFEEVYLHEKDIEAFPAFFTMQGRLKNLRLIEQNDNVMIDYNEEKLFPNDAICTPVSDGTRLDLGDIYVKVIDMPGHTPGSIILQVTASECKDFYLVGDCFNADVTYLTSLNSRLDLLNYAALLRRFYTDIGPEANCYCSHMPCPLSPEIALDVATNCEEIAASCIGGDISFVSVKHTGGQAVPLSLHLCRNTKVIYSSKIINTDNAEGGNCYEC